MAEARLTLLEKWLTEGQTDFAAQHVEALLAHVAALQQALTGANEAGDAADAMKALSGVAAPSVPASDGPKVVMTLGTLRVLADGTVQEYWGPPDGGEWNNVLHCYRATPAERQFAEQLSDFGRELAKALQASWDVRLKMATLEAQCATAREEAAALKADNAALLESLRRLVDGAHPWGMHVLEVVDFSHMRGRDPQAQAGELAFNKPLTFGQFTSFADAFYAAGECTRAKSHPGAALLEEMRALRAEVERMRQDANAQDAAWQERMAGAIKSQHELRQRAAAAERELTAAREQLQQTHQQVAEVARMLDPEVTPDTWGLHSAAEKRMGELTLLRMEKAAALSMSGNGHCIAPPPSSGVVWELVGACKRLRNARAKANVDLAAAVAHANDMERGLTMARERIAVLEKEAAEARQAWEELHTQRAADVLSRDEENSRIREQVERLGALVQQAEAEKQGARDAALEEAGAKMTTHVMEACGCEDTRNCLRAARDDVRALKSSPARFVPEAEVESLRKRAVGLVDFVEDAAKDACEEGGRVLPGCGECGPCVARKALAAWSDAHEG